MNPDSQKAEVEQDILWLKLTSAHDFRVLGPLACML